MVERGYSRDEREAVAAAWRAGRSPACPRCAIPLIGEAVRDPAAVSYVRRRSWLRCPACGASVVADDPRGTR